MERTVLVRPEHSAPLPPLWPFLPLWSVRVPLRASDCIAMTSKTMTHTIAFVVLQVNETLMVPRAALEVALAFLRCKTKYMREELAHHLMHERVAGAKD